MKMLNFAIESLKRRKYKNLAVFLIFSTLITLVFSVFLTSEALKHALYKTLKDEPDIIIQKISAGRMVPMPLERAFEMAEIEGVGKIYPRVWGYYYFKPAGVNFSVVGYEEDMPLFSKALTLFLQKSTLPPDAALIGEGVREVLKKHWFDKTFHFVKPDGTMYEIAIAGVFKNDTLLNYDTILLPMSAAKEVLGLSEEEVSDFALEVTNPKEIENVANKLRFSYPDSRVITRENLKSSYQNVFDYKSGLFLALMISSFFAFFILVFEKASSVGREQAKEIGILKAVGWRIEDVLKLKFLEAVLILIFSYITGILLSYIWVYNLQGVGIREIFSGFSVLKPPLRLEPYFDISLFITIFLISAPLYLAASIIPSWRAAVVDVEEVLR